MRPQKFIIMLLSEYQHTSPTSSDLFVYGKIAKILFVGGIKSIVCENIKCFV